MLCLTRGMLLRTSVNCENQWPVIDEDMKNASFHEVTKMFDGKRSSLSKVPYLNSAALKKYEM